ncbi:hypothetical protein [Flavobacterium sp.]|uniref:hypothetical protein n=1 Tax=Flavobacterium sp. TaxID=239 RepID=UPI00374CF0FD
MENIELYKEFYFREIDRRYELDNSINIPILIISGIVSIHVFLYSQEIPSSILLASKILTFLCFGFGIFSFYYLLKSFSNFFRNHTYRELASMNSFLKYENSLLEKHETITAKKEFDDYLKKEFAECNEHNYKINIGRMENLAKAKSGIFYSLSLTLFSAITYIISIIITQ